MLNAEAKLMHRFSSDEPEDTNLTIVLSKINQQIEIWPIDTDCSAADRVCK